MYSSSLITNFECIDFSKIATENIEPQSLHGATLTVEQGVICV